MNSLYVSILGILIVPSFKNTSTTVLLLVRVTISKMIRLHKRILCMQNNQNKYDPSLTDGFRKFVTTATGSLPLAVNQPNPGKLD